MTAVPYAVALSVCLILPSMLAARAASAETTDATPQIDDHASFDPAPDLQRTPGGNLIVNAFIMQGPVRVEIREQGSERLLIERESDTLFPFELSHRELGAEPEQVVVQIYVDGTLTHRLTLRRAL